MLVSSLKSLRNLTIYSTDDGVISFHATRGLLLLCLVLLGFLRPHQRKMRNQFTLLLFPLNLISKTSVYEKATNYSVSDYNVQHK